MKQYQQLVDTIMVKGEDRGDRTGTGTKSIFGGILSADCQDGFPIMTHKYISLHHVIAELVWFMSGETNINPLQDLSVKIWHSWADEDGDLGPVYGAQWRGRNKRVDQLALVISKIANNPQSRRLLVDSWDADLLPDESAVPSEIGKDIMHLPPCHFAYQFYVSNSGYIDIQWYQR